VTRDRAAWSWDSALSGVIPPLITPLDTEQCPNPAAIAALVEHVLIGGCTGLFVLGGCGAGPWLTSDDRESVVRTTVRAAHSRCPVLVGVMMPSTRTTVAAARCAVAGGADALVLTSPYYFDVDPAAQVRHVEAVLDAVDLPLLLYNIPQCTQQRLEKETVTTLARVPRVLGIKDSAGDFPAFLQFVGIKTQRPDFKVLQGNEPFMGPSLQHGGDGLIPGLANVAPALFTALRHAAAAEDAPACRQLQQKIVALKEIERDGWLPGLMGACAILGIGNGVPPMPYAPAADDHLTVIRKVLADFGLSPAATSTG